MSDKEHEHPGATTVDLSYVVVRPHSNTNPSDKFIVTCYACWLRASEMAHPWFPTLATCDTNDEAEREKDRLNAIALGLDQEDPA
jgi:hypothetical protein